MIRSMTGFGKASGTYQGSQITVEVKSLNSKFLELNLRLPAAYKDRDLELRNEITKVVERGKVDVLFSMDASGNGRRSAFNKTVIRKYYNDLMDLRKEFNLTSDDYLGIIMRLPDIMSNDRSEADPKEWKFMDGLCRKALKAFNEFRIREGRMMQKDFESRAMLIHRYLRKIEKAEPGRLRTLRTRLTRILEDSGEQPAIDKNRFEQELIYYIEKTDITEEKVRLRSHLKFFLDTLREPDSNGKKLGFILQEIGREINTIGSKANDATIQRHVVMMKDELEKMKEQGANVI